MESLLSRIFDPRAMELNLDAKTKEAAFIEIIDRLGALYPECSRDEMLTAILQRENKMSTGIGAGVAIPHAFCGGIGKMAGAIGISHQGIDYGALDNKPVHVIFLLITDEHADENYLHILNSVSKLAQSKVITLIKNAKNTQDIQTILSSVRFN